MCVCVICGKRSLSSFGLLHDTRIQLHTHAASHGIFEESIMLCEFSDTIMLIGRVERLERVERVGRLERVGRGGRGVGSNY